MFATTVRLQKITAYLRAKSGPRAISRMLLFTQVGIVIGNSQIPTGAYSMYLIPQRSDWTLVLNKDVTNGSKYDEQKDLLRIPMEVGQLSEKQQFSVVFAHVSPKQCNLRIYSGKTGTWAEFKEK